MQQQRVLEAAPRPVLIPVSAPLQDALVVFAMSLFIALCARISIPLPYTPVPLTGSTLGVLYAGALLGPARGVVSVALYLLMGGSGLPFLAGGASGWTHFIGATGGYLVGFLPAAWITGALARRGWDRSPLTAALLMVCGSSAIFAFGLIGLSFYVPAGQLLAKGLYPFIIGDLAKSCISAGLLPLGWKLTGRRDR
jgi:biotin transport system substrate-specific component